MRFTCLMLAFGLAIAMPAAPASVPAEASYTWIVVFDEPASASFRGFGGETARPKLAPTSPAATGARRYDAKSAPAQAYVDYLGQQRATRLAAIAAKIGRPVEPRFVYRHATNGVALALTPAEAAAAAGVPGVKRVRPEFHRAVQTNTSMAWIGADEVWNGALPGVGAHRGEGVVVGIIDSGLKRTHVGFAGTGIVNPHGVYHGWCTTVPSACNSKLIGLWNFVEAADGLADPIDDTGHGTHVAGIAVGNAVSIYSGVAPRANIIAYRACDTSCNGAALLASIDQAVADGVDVINYSHGFLPQYDPWAGLPDDEFYDDQEAMLAAREAGIIVVVAAGNSGPGAGTVNRPANAPWVVAVASARDNGSGPQDADLLFPTSSRGPVVPFGIVKPDLSAPGVDITSTWITATTAYATGGGTSMASPHVAGAAALLLSANPALTPDKVVSALVLTARNSVRTGQAIPGDPHDQGNGMLDVAKAARAGLYLPLSPDAFHAAAADPYDGGANQLNLPSIADGACFRFCTMTRTFALMPGAPATDYAVTTEATTPGAAIIANPTLFAGTAAGATLSVTVDVSDPTLLHTWVYGWVTLTDTSGDRPSLRLPVAVYSTPFANAAAEAALSNVTHTGSGERGFFDVTVGGTVDLPDARFVTTALAAPVRSIESIAPDTTLPNPFDLPGSNYVRLIPVPATATPTPYRISARSHAAGSEMVVFLGVDTNDNGQPDPGEQLCISATPGADDECVVTAVHTTAKNYWLIAQNTAGPGTDVEIESVVLAMVPAETPALTATGPGHVGGAAPFAVRVAYDDPTLLPGERRLGVLFLQHAPGETVLEVPFEIARTGDIYAPYGLTPGLPRAVSLPAGPAFRHLYVDIPPGATQATFRTQGTTGEVALYLSRMDIPPGPVVSSSPPPGPALHTATGSGANRTITLTGAQLAAGRWYLTVGNDGAAVADVAVSATIDSVAAVPALRRGAYYNPSRGGHGLFLYPSGTEHALLWYTYLQDGTPTRYYAQGPQPGASQVWNGTVYRAAWNGTSRILTPIGNLVLTPRAAGQLSLTYNIDGFTGAETLDTFLTGCPTHAGQPLDVSAHWYDTASPGYGYSVQVHPAYEFLATFVYDGHGVPRFLAAERGDVFDGGDPVVPLDQLEGFAPLGPYAAPVRTTVGQLTRAYGVSTIQTIGTTAAFVDGVPGTWTRSAAVTRLSSVPQGCDP